MFVYSIKDRDNNIIYIGQTSRTLETRWKGHINRLNNGSNYKLYNKMRKYGTENFTINLPESRRKVSLSKIGRKALKKNGKRKMALPGSNLWAQLLNEGYAT